MPTAFARARSDRACVRRSHHTSGDDELAALAPQHRSMLALQQTAGNQAVQRLLQRTTQTPGHAALLQRTCGGSCGCSTCGGGGRDDLEATRASPVALQREEDDGILGTLGGALGTVTSAVGSAVDEVTGAVATATGAVSSVLGGAIGSLGDGDPGAASPVAAMLAGLDPSTAELLQANMSVGEIAELIGHYGLAGLKAIADLFISFGKAVGDLLWFIVRCGLGLPLRLVVTAIRFALAPSGTSFSEFKPFINIACDCLPNAVLIKLVEYTRMAGEPIAQAHLEHYLHGGGADFPEDVAAFITRDSGGKAAIERQINEQGTAQGAHGSGFSGQAFVMQGEYALQEYLDAWGNVCCIPADAGDEPGAFFFQVLDDAVSRAANLASANARVRLSIRDHYKWHPDEPRPTQCLHQMLEAQKAEGAKEYFEVGTAVVDLTIDPALLPI